MVLLAADIGGTKVALALVTPEGDIEVKRVYPTDPTNPQKTLDSILDFVRGQTIQGVGACLPAVLEHGTDHLVWLPNLAGWNGYPLREKLQAALGCDVVLEYDGHAAVLGEWWMGAARGYQHVASVIIGTGIGGGFVVDGKLWRGRDRLAGAVGWFPMMGPNGLDHWENLASGPAVVRRFRQLVASGQNSNLMIEDITTRAIFTAARQGDKVALDVLNEVAAYIGYGVASIISLVNPQIVVLGGSVGQQGDLLLKIVQDTVQQWAQPISARDIPIVCSTLGEDANLLGMTYVAHARLSQLD